MAIFTPRCFISCSTCVVTRFTSFTMLMCGSLGGKSWNEFRKADCTTDTHDEPDELDIAADAGDPVEPAAVSSAIAPKGVKMPRAVSAKYTDLSAGKQRMKTCVDAYHSNKDAGTLNGLRWIQKGGGFYSICNSKLKGL